MFNWFLNINFTMQLLITFFIGIFVGIFLMNIVVLVKNKKIGHYKRQLEKEALSSDENAAKVKVLESKIKVLEKALENSLNNN
jgi:uncharacterized membrane protein YgaE (UPF0421/DUF939 family)